MARGGKATTFAPGIVQQVAAGLKLMVTGTIGSDWFGPGVPLAPTAPPEVAGRAFDYPFASNVNYVPRGEDPNNNGITFGQLRNLADSLDILRLVIETRKDQVAKMRWVIKKREDDTPRAQPGDKKKTDPLIKEITDLFSFPDGVNDFHSWLRILLEDLFVLDAPALYVQRTNGKKPIGFEPVDGATIKRLIDEGGRTPAAPTPAYQQILKGLPAVDLTTEDLVYLPRNMRAHKLYGFGPVEQIIITVNIGIRRMIGQLAYFTDGSVPEAIATTPQNWTAEQIEQYQDYWDALLAGNDAQRRRMRFVPFGTNFTPLKPELLMDKFDEWLARIICYAFSVSNQPFALQVNRATAETAQKMSLQEGLAPILLWVKTLMDRLLRVYLGHPELEFTWAEEEDQDPLVEAQIDQILVTAGILTKDEVREKRGYDPLPEEKAQPVPTLANGKPFGPTDTAPNAQGVAPVSTPLQTASGADSKTTSAPPAKKLAKAKAKTLTMPEPDPKLEKAIRAAVKKWQRAVVTKVASQITAQMGKLAKKSTLDDLLASIDLRTDTLNAQIEELLKDGWTLASQTAVMNLPGDPAALDAMLQVVNEKGVAWAETHGAELIKGIEDATKSFIREDVATALEEGWSTQELASVLTDNYGFSDDRAERIARTETTDAMNQGTLATWRESGVVDKKQWLTGAGCCEDCAEIEEQGAIPLDDQFDATEKIDDPGDAPPAHPNCRCTMLAVLSETTNDTEA